jgi:hypothetical protein
MPVFRLVATDRCRVEAPWFVWSHHSDPVARLRHLALQLERSHYRRVTTFEQIAAAMLYFPVSLISILRAWRRWGKNLNACYGHSRSQQIRQLVIYAWRLGMCPRMYYHLRLHRHSWRTTGRYFLDQPELHHLQRHIAPDDIDQLEDKLRFAQRMQRTGLPLAPVFTVWRDGRPESIDGEPLPRTLPARDLFVKPVQSYSSAGVQGYRYDPGRRLYQDAQHAWTETRLMERLAFLSRTRPLLVQPWLENDRSLRGFSESALCNFRVVTGRYPEGATVPIMAAFRFPWQSELSCAEPGITLCAAVDLAHGTLRAAEAKDPAIGRLQQHPLTGQKIEGFVLKEWHAVLELALKAHEHWPEFPFVGWDIALTNEGCCLLEGSCLWGGTLAQMSGNPPLGLTPFPAIYLAHLAARNRDAA